MVRLHAFFSGHVQGVGFRWRCARLAEGRPVAGFVRNVSDGRVELAAEGERPALAAFLTAIEGEMEGLIRRTDSSWEPATGEFSGFGILS